MTGLMISFFRGYRLRDCFAVFGLLVFFGALHGCANMEESIGLSPHVAALLEKYPAGSIDSVEKADEVRDAVSREDRALEETFAREMDQCVERFLVTLCYDETRFRFRMDRAALKPLSVEADRFKRSEKVRVRDMALLDAAQEEQGKASQREDSLRRYKEKEARYIQEEMALPGGNEEMLRNYLDVKAGDEASPPKTEGGAYTITQPSRPKDPDTTLTPQKRAQNVSDYEEKRTESERKQESVQRRMEETQGKREKRAASAQKEVKKKQKVAKD